ncbi:MAG: hypothetical protein LBF19_01135 [Prevotellaceae bacterium]|nr:hypothetical protein [Prevotellaceae bacterium]
MRPVFSRSLKCKLSGIQAAVFREKVSGKNEPKKSFNFFGKSFHHFLQVSGANCHQGIDLDTFFAMQVLTSRFLNFLNNSKSGIHPSTASARPARQPRNTAD